MVYRLPVALMGAVTNGMSTVNAQTTFLLIFKSLQMPLSIARGGLMISATHTIFDENGA
jgi:hypothetical protein